MRAVEKFERLVLGEADGGDGEGCGGGEDAFAGALLLQGAVEFAHLADADFAVGRVAFALDEVGSAGDGGRVAGDDVDAFVAGAAGDFDGEAARLQRLGDLHFEVVGVGGESARADGSGGVLVGIDGGELAFGVAVIAPVPLVLALAAHGLDGDAAGCDLVVHIQIADVESDGLDAGVRPEGCLDGDGDDELDGVPDAFRRRLPAPSRFDARFFVDAFEVPEPALAANVGELVNVHIEGEEFGRLVGAPPKVRFAQVVVDLLYGVVGDDLADLAFLARGRGRLAPQCAVVPSDYEADDGRDRNEDEDSFHSRGRSFRRGVGRV